MMRMTGLLAAAVIASLSTAAADDWPTRPITVVVPYGPGSGNDVLGRILAPPMSEFLGQSVIVENVSGGGGTIGTARVAKAPADGYQSVLGTAATNAQVSLLYKHPKYQPLDFAPVALITDAKFVLITRKDFPADSLQQFIAYAKANHSTLKYGSPGLGSAGHLACALLNNAIGADVMHIPYRGAAQAMTDLIGGVIDYQCAVVSVVLSQGESKMFKSIALLSTTRSPYLPNLASSAEQGLPDFDASTWNAMFLPKETPTEIVQKLNASIISAMKVPVVRDRLHTMGFEPPAGKRTSPDYLRELVDSDMKKWAAPIRAANISVD